MAASVELAASTLWGRIILDVGEQDQVRRSEHHAVALNRRGVGDEQRDAG
jgi:hypothetical protein